LFRLSSRTKSRISASPVFFPRIFFFYFPSPHTKPTNQPSTLTNIAIHLPPVATRFHDPNTSAPPFSAVPNLFCRKKSKHTAPDGAHQGGRQGGEQRIHRHHPPGHRRCWREEDPGSRSRPAQGRNLKIPRKALCAHRQAARKAQGQRQEGSTGKGKGGQEGAAAIGAGREASGQAAQVGRYADPGRRRPGSDRRVRGQC
ncbi:hypothetical protein TRIATDRAFT_296998, partial [Trichoderma atroviride IMI 206040]